ncbi:MAG TPA: hypothetical protein VFT56_17235 [Sphingomonas sp.]|nr:hypothetical protein [Sphingomonas sp.]
MLPEPPAPRRDIFAGLDLRSVRNRPAGRSTFDGLRLSAAPTVTSVERTPLDRAVEHYARAGREIIAARREGDTELPHQRAAFEKTGKALDAVQPHGADDLRAAFNRDASLIDAAAKGRTATAIRAMMLESEVRTNPARRADRFVEDWRRLASNERGYREVFDDQGAARMRSSMGAMAKGLERDPQVESLLRKRLPELGIKMSSGASLSHDLQQWLGRSRGLGIGM